MVSVFVYLLTSCQLLVERDLLRNRNVFTTTTPLSCARCSIQCEFVGFRPKLNFSGWVVMILQDGLAEEATAGEQMETKRRHSGRGLLAMRGTSLRYCKQGRTLSMLAALEFLPWHLHPLPSVRAMPSFPCCLFRY